MKYTRLIMIGLAFIFVIYVFSVVYQDRIKNDAQNIPISTNQSETNNRQWETKTDDQPPVTIKVTPIEIGKDAQAWKFNIVLDTHSVELDQNLIQIATLVDDKENVYTPIVWEGSGPGGHHREGILIFNALGPAPQSVTKN